MGTRHNVEGYDFPGPDGLVWRQDDDERWYQRPCEITAGEYDWRLVTERPLGARESRVERCVLSLRSSDDALTIAVALRLGTLRPRAGVRAWVCGSRA